MKFNQFSLLATGVLGTLAVISLSNLPIKQAQANGETQFICAESFDNESGKSLPTTFAWTSRGKIAIVRWETEDFLSAGFSPQKRCESVSPRFQEAYDNNTLGLITNGQMDNQSVICTSDRPQGDCNTLLMTLRPEDDSLTVLGSLRDIFNGQQVGPVKHNKQAYYQVDIENFLETAPVEGS
ncbi:MAG: COP23 domain-containing protein [Cyanobacteria bacterium P01_A01_bin.83]